MPDPSAILPNTLVFPEKTLSGRGQLAALPAECQRFGPRGLILHGAALARSGRLESLLKEAPRDMVILTTSHTGGEPTLKQVAELIRLARNHQASWIAGIGGGSIMDLAKAAATLVNAPMPPVHYHDGAAIPDTGLTFVAVPTTAGTGAEATLNSVLTNEITGIKKSIRAPGMMARLVILDPTLLATCPPPVIAASGMDAMTQAIEAYTSCHATWLSDTLALQAAKMIGTHLERVYQDSSTPAAEPLLVGSYLAGVALSFARLGVVHGMAHPLGSLYHLPHGLVCAACLPHAIELNRDAFGPKYAHLGSALGGDLLDTVGSLMLRLDLKSPFTGKTLQNAEKVISETLSSGSTKANPKPITRADVEWLLARLFSH